MSNPSNSKSRSKYRTFLYILYPDCQEHMAMLQYLKDWDQIYDIAYILHDRDTWSEEDGKKNPEHKAGSLKKVHYHILFQQKEFAELTSVRKFFAPFADPKAKNQIEACSSVDSSLRYFLHMTPSSMGKVRYAFDDLCGSPKLLKRVLKENSSFTQFRALLNTLKCSDGKLYNIADAIEEQGLLDHYDNDDLMSVLARYQGIVCTSSNQIRSDCIKGV